MSGHPIWILKAASPLAPELSKRAGITPLQAQLLINRGISDLEGAEKFLRPRLAHMADPSLLKNMDAAVARIIWALEAGERILVYGDYDADGLTAAALLVNFFSSIGVPVLSHIPHRLRDGYGINSGSIKQISARGVRLIITVDCGISNPAEIALAKALGMDVIVTDHHRVPDGVSMDCPAINPHQPDCPFPFQPLSGVGLAFYLVAGLRRGLRERGWFTRRPEPDLREFLDLVALGTVADRVPLLGQNRILVKAGIDVMGRTRWAGLKAIKESADITTLDESGDDLAFRLAPRLNAPGRIGDPAAGMEILTERDGDRARALASQLHSMNVERQRLERVILDSILDNLGPSVERERFGIMVLAGETWHPGVLGIVAARLVEEYYRPALVLSIQNGSASGSGRSIAGFDLHGALSRCGDLLEKFGGHAHAAGFTLPAENLAALEQRLNDIARDTVREEDRVPCIPVEAELALTDVNMDLLRQVNELAPFGEGNPQPLFLGRSLEVASSRVVGDQHLRLRVRQGQKSLEAIGFGMGRHHPLSGRISMVFAVELNRWQGRERIELRVCDLVPEDSGGQLDILRAEDEQGPVPARQR